MKGLLLKDFYMIRKYCRVFFFIIVIFLFTSFLDEEYISFMTLYPCVFAGMIPMTLIAYDEQEKWNVYCQTMPYTKAQIVSVKYLVSLLFTAFIVGVNAIVQAVRLASTPGVSLTDYFLLNSLLLFVSLFTPSVIMPFTFRYGSEKGRLVYYVIIGALCGSLLVLTRIGVPSVSLSASAAAVWMSAAAVALFAASWKLSLSSYQKREDC